MATISSNASWSSSSASISGTTDVLSTISWTVPTIPSGAIIKSCVLTGTPTITMNKGTGTVTVNGTTVTSGSQFSINLGTGNTTNSVQVSCKGSNKNASGTVTFNNLVYTVTYTLEHTVTFKDWDGTTLKTQTVEDGASATAPANPTRDGYVFTGWDIDFSNVTNDLAVTAQYAEIQYFTVTFKDWDGTVLETQTVESGKSATAPSNPTREGYNFTGWDVSFSNVTNNLTVIAQYEKIEEPEEEVIEWTGLGTIATGLRAHDVEHNNYKINIDWNTQYFDIIVTEDFNYLFSELSTKVNIAYLDKITIGNNIYESTLSVSNNNINISIYGSTEEYPSYNIERNYPYTIRFAKEGIYILYGSTSNLIMERNYDLDTIYFNEDGSDNYPLSNIENGDYDVAFDLVVSERPNEDPEEDVIEWTGVGTVATNLSTEDDWTYKLNIDWDTQYVEINNIVANSKVFSYGADVLYMNNEYNFTTGDQFYCDETEMLVINSDKFGDITGFYSFKFSIKISKNDGLVFISNLDDSIYEIKNYHLIENSPVLYLSSLVRTEQSYSEIGEIKVVALENIEEPDNNELIQGDINDETGVYEDEVSNVVKTKYIDISDKKQIMVNVLTEDVYILKCYLYNANKELVKVIDISADKKRMFGLDLQKLIEEVMNDGNE